MSIQLNNGSNKITEALSYLNDAAKDKKEELRKALVERYEHFQEAFEDTVHQGQKNLKNAQKVASRAMEDTAEKLKETAEDVNRKVKKNPWPYIGVAAATGVLIGFILGSIKNRD